MRFARIAATSDGDNTVVDAATIPEDKRIRVLNYVVNANAAGVCGFQTSESTPTVLATWEFADSAAAHSFNGTMESPAFDLPLGVGLEVNVASSVDLLGHICYEVV